MTNRNRVRLSKLALGLALALAAAPSFAQNTSAALGGTITDSSGQPVSGATVTIVHEDSGTSSTATTDANGGYIARGLRVGGPYKVTITKDGQTQTREGVFLNLGETGDLDAKLVEAVELGAVTVVGTGGVFSSNAMGAGTDLSSEQLNNFPSIQRDLQDYARLDPRLSQTDKERGEISVAGQNSRYNSITVDSVSVNDTFGLEANNLPTIRQPISMDAIPEADAPTALAVTLFPRLPCCQRSCFLDRPLRYFCRKAEPQSKSLNASQPPLVPRPPAPRKRSHDN